MRGAPSELFALGTAPDFRSVLIRQGRARRSPALQADGKHVFTDVVTSTGGLVGVALVALTGTGH